MILNNKDYENKLLGCWFGKNIGGTLGMPFEWRRQLNDVKFYTHDIDGEPIPNDDLDIQLLWLIAMEQQGVKVNTRLLSYYFSAFVTPHWAEYGTAKANMKLGLSSPQCGLENNPHKDSCGSYIRSEIWACICAATPELAVKYMLADSQIDHGGRSEGTYAAIAVAAMQAAAFAEKDINSLIDIGMSYIPKDCAIAGVTKLVRECYAKKLSYTETRDKILESYRGAPFTYYTETETVRLCSPEDAAKGFDKGVIGYDVPSNFGIIILALLYGKGDFEKTIILAVNCGEDSDCTAATAGALLGIILGYDKLPKKWIDPIGGNIKTCCLNYGELDGVNGLIPANVFELTERVTALSRKVKDSFGLRVEFSEQPTEKVKLNLKCTEKFFNDLYRCPDAAVYEFPFFDISVEYNGSCGIGSGETKTISVYIENKYRISENIEYKLYMPEGFTCAAESEGFVYVAKDTYGDFIVRMDFPVTAENISKNVKRFVFEAVVVGRGETMLVPVTLIRNKKN